MLVNKAYDYCKKCINEDTTPKYVKLQMKDFIDICDGKNEKYVLSEKKLEQLNKILKILIMPKGLKAGKTLYECSTGYQWLFYTAILCVVYKDNPNKRRYEIGLLEICRKNFKTYTIGTLFLILFITEPKFSSFYSVAPVAQLSKEIQKAISETIRSSLAVYEFRGKKRFKITRDYIKFLPKDTTYIPLAFSTSTLDGKLPNVWCADEVGALNTSYPIEAMKSGQLNITNKLGFIISTKYPTIDNPFEDEVKYSKNVLDGLENDETRFSLLYEPNETENWGTDDMILKQANPVALEINEIWEDLLKKRAYAIAVESARENFVTKHCNIAYQGTGTESYIDVKDVQKCKVTNIDWQGRLVYVGLDLSMSNDNTSVTMVSVDDDNNILSKSFAFIPSGRIDEKSSYEKVNYRELLKTENVIECGDMVIDYSVVEDFIMNLENKYGVTIQAIGYDRYNCLSTATKLEKYGMNCVEVKQHSSVLHSPTKLLKEKILKGEFQYTENKLYEINFQNARCSYDTNLNLYVHKKKSSGKVDMVVSTINAVYLLQQDMIFGDDFTIQVI